MAGWVRLLAALLVGLAVLLSGCGAVRIPADPDGTLDRVRGGVLRVGVSPHEPWTTLAADEPGGIEPDLMRGWAAGLSAQVVWTVGGEQALVQAMERGELDLVLGGITADTPGRTWPRSPSRSPPRTARTGRRSTWCWTPMGENAFLAGLEALPAGAGGCGL